MKMMTKTQSMLVAGGDPVIGVTTGDPDMFDWGEFGVITTGLTLLGALMGTVMGSGNPTSRSQVVGSMVGGALLAGGLGAVGDTVHQLSPTTYYTRG